MKKSPVNLSEKLLCPCCSGELSYDISRQQISCCSCGMKLTPEEYEAAAAARSPRRERASASFSSESSQSSSSSSPSSASKPEAGETENRSSGTPDFLSCESCRLLVSRGVADLLGECPVCHTKISGMKNSSGESPAGESSPENPGFAAPDLIVPFSKEKEFFIQEFRKRLRNLELAPDSFLEASIENVRAFYVPAVLYDAEVSGEMSFHGEVLTEVTIATRSCCKLEEFETEAAGSQLYSASPEKLTCEISDDVFRNLEPFDIKEARPWSRIYAEIPDLTIPAITSAFYFGRSQMLFREAFEYFLADGKSYTRFSPVKGQASVIPLKISYAWLPVWVMELRQGGQEMHCYMNGQTGKLEADIPVSEVKIFCWLLSGLILLAGVAACLSAPFYMELSKINDSSVLDVLYLGTLIMIFPMMIYAEIAPVRRLFCRRRSSRLAGSLMAGAGAALMAAACLSAPGDCGKNFLFILALLAGGFFAVLFLRGGIKARLAGKSGQNLRNEGRLYAAKSYLRYRNRRKTGEKMWRGRVKADHKRSPGGR